MKVLIIEDEQLSADRLKALLEKYNQDISVLAVLDSVKSVISWFRDREAPDLVFMDIQLADGISFEIFDSIRIEVPIIFITAYQEYAIKAFKVNSVDYLLKPIEYDDLVSALSKYETYFIHNTQLPVLKKEILDDVKRLLRNQYKNRFIVKVGDRIKSIGVNEILYFYSLEKGTYLHTADNRNYAIDYSLDTLGEMLDPSGFFRINRKYIVTHQSINELVNLSGTRIAVDLKHAGDSKVYISRERVPDFKAWLDN